MVSDPDIYRCAHLMLQQHGIDNAAIFAAQRADELLGRGDVEGASVWRRIVKAIDVLSRGTAPPDMAAQ